jgi:propanol-preferring alcohol dehydrogenase
MKAQILKETVKLDDNVKPLELVDAPIPQPDSKQILVNVLSCAVCHTELDEIEGRVKSKLPVILGHQIVGEVKKSGSHANKFKLGDRIGIAWINSACGECYFCRKGNENLCNQFQSTGCDADGGYAEYTVVREDFAYLVPEIFTDLNAAPLLCGGAIGWRALKLTEIEDGETLALFGFGASARIVIQIVKHKFPNSKVFVFTRSKGDLASQLAKEEGADWIGQTGENPPEKYNRAIDTTPVGPPVAEALRNLEKGGKLVMNLIRKETPIPQLDYAKHLWEEKELKSVANITRKDVEEFLSLAAQIPITTKVEKFKLEEANNALIAAKRGNSRGTAVLKIT